MVGVEPEFGAGMELGTDDRCAERRSLVGERVLGGMSGLLGRGVGLGMGRRFLDAWMWTWGFKLGVRSFEDELLKVDIVFFQFFSSIPRAYIEAISSLQIFQDAYEMPLFRLQR